MFRLARAGRTKALPSVPQKVLHFRSTSLMEGSAAKRARAAPNGDRPGPSEPPTRLIMEGSAAKSARVAPTRAAPNIDRPGPSEPAAPSSVLSTDKPVRLQGYVCTDHVLKVPLDHFKDPNGPTIEVFAREVVATNKVLASQPYLCFFQGGPGFESPVPSDGIAWLNAASKHFRIILLDQRGTGRSTPIFKSTLQAVGSVEQQAQYLRHFRADSIVADAEMLRKVLTPQTGEKKRWCALGQSFGGFCLTHYLSKSPEGLLEVFLTGGIPPLIDERQPADEVYNATFRRVMVQNDKYYSRFPGDVKVVKDIVNFLAAQPDGGVRTPCGTMLRPRTLQVLGMSTLGGGGAGGGFERLHFVLASAFNFSQGKPELTPRFLRDVDAMLPFDANPLYALLHEAIYSQGPATRWAAHRVREKQFKTVFDAEATAASSSGVVFFTGEMVFPWMFEDIASLRPFKDVAQAVAEMDGWSKLYDTNKLQQNRVPVASATYCEDMYVDFNLAQETAAKINGMRQWMTNEFQHSGLRDDGANIFDTLLSMTRGSRVLF